MRWFLVCAALASASPAAAQTQPGPSVNPIVQHFRAYRAALEAGDLALAETEADAALQASVARDGDGGRTAILAMNLAQVRLDRGRAREALAPAQQAFNITTAQPSAGVDPLIARLALGRAELAANGRAGASLLSAALTDAESRPDLITHAYAAAAALGQWNLQEHHFADAQANWVAASRFSAGAPAGADFGRAEARLAWGVATYFRNAENESIETVGTHIPRTRDYQPALDAFSEARRLTARLAHHSAPSEGITPAQYLYAQALAWRNLTVIRMPEGERNIQRARDRGEMRREIAQAVAGESPSVQAAICDVELVAEPAPVFPASARSGNYLVGSVVIRTSLNPDGSIADARIAAALPERWFAEAVERVFGQWRYVRGADSAEGCQMLAVSFVSYSFGWVNR